MTGGYAEYSLVPDYKYLIKISGLDLEGAASLSCSGLTAYTAVKKAISNSPENILIIGAGGLGLMGVQIAKALSNANIICADLDDEKLKKAQEMGADHVVNTKDSGASKNIMTICNEKGADSIIDFVNSMVGKCNSWLSNDFGEAVTKHTTSCPISFAL